MINVDVILITYDEDEEIFKKTINSINQAFKTAKNYFKLVDLIIIGKEVKGRGRARDVGWRKGKSDFILFVDTGVSLSNNWLVEMHMAIKNIDGDVWFGNSSEAANSKHFLAKCSEIEFKDENDRLCKKDVYVPVRSLNTSNIIFKRKILEKINGFDVHLPFCEDTEIGYRITKIGGKIIYVCNAKATNIHRIKLYCKLKQNWERGLGQAYIKNKHPKYSIHLIMYILLPYSCIKRIFTWSFQYGWIGLNASIIYFLTRLTKLIGFIYGYIFGFEAY